MRLNTVMMVKNTKRRVFISKIHNSKSRLDFKECYFWYQVGTGSIRTLVKGTKKELFIKRAEIIEKYKLEYIKLGV